MAFIRQKGKTFYIVENQRIGGKVKQKVLACLSDCPDIDTYIAECRKHQEEYEELANDDLPRPRRARPGFRRVIAMVRGDRYLARFYSGRKWYEIIKEYQDREWERSKERYKEPHRKEVVKWAERIAKLEKLRGTVDTSRYAERLERRRIEREGHERRLAELVGKFHEELNPKPKDWSKEYHKALNLSLLGKPFLTPWPEGLAITLPIGVVPMMVASLDSTQAPQA
jgi:hypothetical protein